MSGSSHDKFGPAPANEGAKHSIRTDFNPGTSKKFGALQTDFTAVHELDSHSIASAHEQRKPGVIWQARSEKSEPLPPGVPRLLWDILNARGIRDEEKLKTWLTPSLKTLRDPFTLIDMEKAIARLVNAFEKGERICIYGDYDLDGTSALALLSRGFELLGFKNYMLYQPSRLNEGYGLHKSAIDKLVKDKVELILTVDLGITAVEEVRHASQNGIDVIITDHHLPKEEIPEAIAVVNPNRKECSASLGHLCGTGVAFYLLLALKRALQERDLLKADFDAKQVLDCFVIGTLTDMVPLLDENRVLVKHGLVSLASTSRPGLRVLLQALGLWGQPLTSQDVAIRFAPKLNALSRMEMGVRPLDLFLVASEAEAQKLVETVLSNNQTRLSSQKDAEFYAAELCELSPQAHCICLFSKRFHRGIVGLVATKLSQKFKLPVFVGAETEAGLIVGSARMPNGCQANLLEAMEHGSAFLKQFGGHAMAAGFELTKETAFDFSESLREFFKLHPVRVGSSSWFYDAEASLHEFNPSFMSWYDHLGPFGVEFVSPVVLVRDAKVVQIRELKGGHLRISIAQDRSTTQTALWFSPLSHHELAQGNLKVGQRVDALVEPQWNYFQGNKSIQLLIQDIRLTQSIESES